MPIRCNNTNTNKGERTHYFHQEHIDIKIPKNCELMSKVRINDNYALMLLEQFDAQAIKYNNKTYHRYVLMRIRH